MRNSTLIGLASTVFRARKYRFLIAGIQFGYLGYRMLQKRAEKRRARREADESQPQLQE